jgi:FkbM family methyltransferase
MTSLQAQWNYLKSQAAFRRYPLHVLGRLVVWRIRCAAKAPVIVPLKHFNIDMFLPAEWHGIAKLVFAFREQYEPELALLPRFLSPGSVFLDVGANYGIYSLVASRIVGGKGAVFAFEPAIGNFQTLEKNLRINRCQNVFAYKCALSNQEGHASLYHDRDPSRYSLVKREGVESETVEMCTLDRWMKISGLKRVDFVKIDTEGADELVLRGAMQTLQIHRPVVLFEQNPAAARGMGLSPDGTLKLLRTMNYTVFHYNGKGLQEVDSSVQGGNLIAVPGLVR